MGTMPQKTNGTLKTWGISLLLALVTLAAYWGVFSSGFVDMDDPYYVVQNQQVQSGLSWDGLSWAFTSRDCDNWHPVTWVSLMLDCSLYGSGPAGFHTTNLALHILNTILLFLLLQLMTRARWRSAFVAALFALHPLHVESVAWIAERKDVLSTLFGLLTLRAYLWYAKTPETKRYWPVLLFFALGLMAKPMLVTLPLLLLLLDFWPLKRMPPAVKFFGRVIEITSREDSAIYRRTSPDRLVLEKIPLFALAAISSALTIWAQQKAIQVAIHLEFRLLNAALSYLRYMVKMIWPGRLYVNYPYPQGWPIWYPIIAAVIVGYVSFLAVRQSRKRPYVFVGWFWFLIALLPVIGLVQVGIQSMADRYTYIPLVGLFIAITWLVCDLVEQWRFPKIMLRVLAVAAVVGCMFLTIVQVGYWKNSFTLFHHALRLNPSNYFVEVNLAMSYSAKKEYEPALEHLVQASKINPYSGKIYNKIGWVQFKLGKYQDAVESYKTALQRHGEPALAHYGMALALEKEGKLDEAVEQIQAAMVLEPGNQENIEEYNRIMEKLEKQKTGTLQPAPP